MQILQRLHEDDARSRVISIAVLQQQMNEISHEKNDERHRRTQQANTSPATYILVSNVVHYIKDAQRASKEHHGATENQDPGVEQRIKPMRGVSPTADDRSERTGIDKILFGNDEVAALKEGGNGTA